jgi:hypothetical protein
MKPFRSALALLPALVLLAAPILRAQQPAPPAPVPAPIRNAQKIFIANAGMDAFSLQAFEELGLNGANAYDSLYAAVKSWPQYQLVSSPADADLVLEIRVTAPLTNVGDHPTWSFQHIAANTTWQFQTDLVIRDAKDPLPALDRHGAGAPRQPDRNLAQEHRHR